MTGQDVAAELTTLHENGRLEIILEPGMPGAGAFTSPDGRQSLIDAIVHRPEGTRSILVRGANAKVFNGPDLPTGGNHDHPRCDDLVKVIEACELPIAFLVDGVVSGLGAEVFLAAHLRLSTPRASFAFPALASGRLPGQAATLRLTRSIGAEQALRLFRTGTRIAAAEALALGLVDHIIDPDDPEGGREKLHSVLQNRLEPFPSLSREQGLQDGRACLRAIAAAKREVSGSLLPAEHALIDCVEAALLLPVPQALDFVADRESEVARSPEAAALAYIHRAELRAATFPYRSTPEDAQPVRHFGIAGAEPAFLGLAFAALSRGLAVTVADPDREKLVAFLEKIAARQEASVQGRTMTEAQRDADWARLSPVLDLAALDSADLILASAEMQAVPLRKKRPVLVYGKGDLPPSGIPLVVTGRVAEVGLSDTTPSAFMVWAFLRRMGLFVVPTGHRVPTGIAGRLSRAGALAIRSMVELGVDANAIRSALTAFGQLVPPISAVENLPERKMASDEIVNRWLGALANEAIRMLQAGVATNAGDIDLVAVAGMRFPRMRGGPLHQADQKGLLILRRDLTDWSKDGPIWTPVPGLDAMVSAGRGFAGAVTPE